MTTPNRRRVFSANGLKPISELRTKEDRQTFSALESKFFVKNALLDFLAAFQLKHRRSPTLSHIYKTGLATEQVLKECLRELIGEQWIREIQAHGNGCSYETDVFE